MDPILMHRLQDIKKVWDILNAEKDDTDEDLVNLWHVFTSMPMQDVNEVLQEITRRLETNQNYPHHDYLYEIVAITWTKQKMLSSWKAFFDAVNKSFDEIFSDKPDKREEYYISDFELTGDQEVDPLVELLDNFLQAKQELNMLAARMAFREKKEDTHELAQWLRNRGFTVKAERQWGINFEGDPELFLSVFWSNSPDTPCRVGQTLTDLGVESVYFPSEVKMF